MRIDEKQENITSLLTPKGPPARSPIVIRKQIAMKMYIGICAEMHAIKQLDVYTTPTP